MPEENFNIDKMGLQLGPEASILAEAMISDVDSKYDFLVRSATANDGLTEDNAASLRINEHVAGTRVRMLKMMEDSDRNVQHLIKQFTQTPALFHAYCRNNILRLVDDPQLTPQQREGYIQTFLDAYIDLIIQLDHAVFKPSDEVVKGIPPYIPDGLSDMGGNPNLTNRDGREKIRIRKDKIYAQHRDLINRVFSEVMNSEDIVIETAKHVFGKREYTLRPARQILPDHMLHVTVDLDAMNDKKVGVCRQDALNFQVLMQLFGFDVKLFKCTLGGPTGSHATNLVRIKKQWYLIDVTNPDSDGTVFIQKISPTSIDLNGEDYGWSCKTRDGKKREYRNRKTMYYRIRDNDEQVLEDEEVASDLMTEDDVITMYDPFEDTVNSGTPSYQGVSSPLYDDANFEGLSEATVIPDDDGTMTALTG